MNERVRMTENGARPDVHSPAPNPYYFPPASYGAPPQPHAPQSYAPQPYAGQPHAGQPHAGPIPQRYPQHNSYPSNPGGPALHQPGALLPPGYRQPGPPPPLSPPPGFGQPEPAAPVNMDDAVAQIAARMQALDGDPYAARPPFVPSSPPPIAPDYAYSSDPYAPPHARHQQAYAPPLAPSYPHEGARYGEPQPYAPPYYPEPQYYAERQSLAAAAPGPDLSGLESQLRNLTAQIETLRQPPMPDFSGALAELRKDLAEISVRLMEAMPRRAIDALEAEVRRLADRIEATRSAGIDPDAVAGMERSLNEVRDAIRSLKPAESLAGFEQAIRNLADRIDQSGAYQDPASLRQLEDSIAALRGIVSNVASNDTLAGLSEEVRGLAAKVDRVASSPRGMDSDMLQSLEQRIASLPVLGAIERGFADLKARLDAIQIPAPQPAVDPAPVVDHLKRDLVRTQDSLEAVHSTLGHLVDRLAMIEGGIREARFAAETPEPMPAAMPAKKPEGAFPAPKTEIPLAPAMPEAPRSLEAAAIPQPAPTAKPGVAAQDLPKPPPAADIRPVAMNIAKPAAAQGQQAAPQTKPAARERNPIDPHLPPDFPLEPGSGLPKARPNASAAERIAASEAALGSAKPGSANHPGQTNFIAAARRAAQAAATTATQPGSARPDDEADKAGKSIGQKMRSLFVGAGAVILIAASARVAIDMLDTGNQSAAEISAPLTFETAETREPQPKAAPTIAAPSTLPVKTPELFTAPASGVIVPERPKAALQAPIAQAEPEATGSIGRRAATPESQPVRELAPPARASAREPVPVLPDRLPAALRNAALKGQAAAEYEVGIRQIEGRTGIAQNTEAGLRWLERAAQQGLAPAHFRLAGLYEKGLGVKKNLETARRHYVAAAEKGNAKAMHNLAVLYAEGIDGKPDYKTAADWFRRASEYGIADSQYNLGILFARGIGIEQNLPESYKWFALAAVQGDRDAAKKRDDVGAKLDAASLAAARAAIQSFTAQQQPDDAVSVSAPPGGWDRPAAETAPTKKPRSGSVARVTAL